MQRSAIGEAASLATTMKLLDHKRGSDVLCDGILAIAAFAKTIPVWNMLASGNVEMQLKSLMAAGIQTRHNRVRFVMDKQLAVHDERQRPIVKQQVDLLLTSPLWRAIAVECKCTFARDTSLRVIQDALNKAHRNWRLVDVPLSRSCIVHFLNDTEFGSDLGLLPHAIRKRFERIYRAERCTPTQLFDRYRDADERRQIKNAAVVALKTSDKRVRFDALVIDLKHSRA